MESKIRTWILAPFLCALLVTTGCAPISGDSHPTGANTIGALGGGAIGAGVTAAFNAPAPVIGVAGVAGASLGYYLTTLSFSMGGIAKVHGRVYVIGEYVTIDVPSDNLFDPNTSEFLDNTDPVLDSIVSVLKRFPNHNLIISGNTSGFGTSRFEIRLSQARAEQVASYLWLHGITDTFPNVVTGNKRRLIYVGYGDQFPIANNLRIPGIRANSRIQIVAYPCDEELHWDKEKPRTFKKYDNVIGEGTPNGEPYSNRKYSSAFGSGDLITGQTAPNPPLLANVPAPPPSVKNFATIDSDQLRQEFTALPTPNKDEKPDLIPTLEAKLKPSPTPPAIIEAQKSVTNEPQTVVGSNVKKHWGSKEDVTLKDETPPYAGSLPAPDPDALPSVR